MELSRTLLRIVMMMRSTLYAPMAKGRQSRSTDTRLHNILLYLLSFNYILRRIMSAIRISNWRVYPTEMYKVRRAAYK